MIFKQQSTTYNKSYLKNEANMFDIHHEIIVNTSSKSNIDTNVNSKISQVTTSSVATSNIVEESPLSSTSTCIDYYYYYGGDDSSKNRRCRKRVTFDRIYIREYVRILGDHPWVRHGPALGIDWNYYCGYSDTYSESNNSNYTNTLNDNENVEILFKCSRNLESMNDTSSFVIDQNTEETYETVPLVDGDLQLGYSTSSHTRQYSIDEYESLRSNTRRRKDMLQLSSMERQELLCRFGIDCTTSVPPVLSSSPTSVTALDYFIDTTRDELTGEHFSVVRSRTDYDDVNDNHNCSDIRDIYYPITKRAATSTSTRMHRTMLPKFGTTKVSFALRGDQSNSYNHNNLTRLRSKEMNFLPTMEDMYLINMMQHKYWSCKPVMIDSAPSSSQLENLNRSKSKDKDVLVGTSKNHPLYQRNGMKQTRTSVQVPTQSPYKDDSSCFYLEGTNSEDQYPINPFNDTTSLPLLTSSSGSDIKIFVLEN